MTAQKDSATDSKTRLAAYGERVNDALRDFFAELPELLNLELSEQSERALRLLQDYTLRPSKRIRGSLAAYAYDFASKTQQGKPGIQLGVALELVQSYLLIIDDVMDKSELRRGQPTLHELFAKHTDRHTANMLAVNIGLIAQHLANIALARSGEAPERLRQASLHLHRNITATGFGQMDDVSQHADADISETEIIQKYRLKSGYYTFVNPLQTGLILGGVIDDKVLEEIEIFGLAAGIAFQLHDDILGIFGDEDAVGKSNLDDIKEGKYTLLVQYALQHASDTDVKILRHILGNDAVSEGDLGTVRNIFERCGAKSYVAQQAAAYAESAKKHLTKNIIWNAEAQVLLASLVEFSVQRQK